ncbi:MAG: hypothetical protein QOK25_42 [Thermoleophilaceae bacterium]|nr:hypothetical protein [Thermoleophilaceae bacterium]
MVSLRVLQKCGFRPYGAPTAAEDGIVEIVLRLSRSANG